MTVSLRDAADRAPIACCDPCLVCAGGPFVAYAGGRPDLARCAACGFVTMRGGADPETLSSLYEQDYFHGAEYADYVRDRPALQRNFGERVKTMRRYCRSGTLLEIGCAYGFFLDLVRDQFDCRGYDRVETAVAYANKVLSLRAECKDFLAENSIPAGSIDVVAMWDVIEHLENPERYLERTRSLLKEGGYLFLTTGDIDSWNARRRKAKWRLIKIRSHLHFFSRDTIGRLLERQGFEVIDVSYPGYFRSIDQMLYNILVLGKNHPRLYRLLSFFIPRKAMLYINLFDIMCVVARRPRAASSTA
ncbi:MAG: class I SAM-dependent methyltransferase [Nitrospira sp.]|nr:class I SAM-dependent methyltransferase [Nitrospira sp.]